MLLLSPIITGPGYYRTRKHERSKARMEQEKLPDSRLRCQVVFGTEVREPRMSGNARHICLNAIKNSFQNTSASFHGSHRIAW